MNKLLALSKRNIKVYTRDKASVFFSFLSVLIVFFLYILFIGKNLKDGMQSSVAEFNISSNIISMFADAWMICGVIGIACVTVANGSLYTVVSDTFTGIKYDFYVAPVKRLTIVLSYFISAVVVTFTINAILFIAFYFYILAGGMQAIAVMDFLYLLFIIFLSTLSATTLMMVFALLIKTDNAYGIFSSIIGVTIGFLTGGYMPMSVFPEAVVNFSNFVPARGAIVLLRRILMQPVIDELVAADMPAEAVEGIQSTFGLNMHFGSWQVPEYLIIIYMIFSIFVFLGISFLLIRKAKNK